MSTINPKVLEYLQSVTGSLEDCKVITEQELRALVWFHIYGPNETSQVGREWRGCSFRQRPTTCLLVVKTSCANIPQVAFVTDRDPMGCILTFIRKWYEESLHWVPDKYA